MPFIANEFVDNVRFKSWFIKFLSMFSTKSTFKVMRRYILFSNLDVKKEGRTNYYSNVSSNKTLFVSQIYNHIM